MLNDADRQLTVEAIKKYLFGKDQPRTQIVLLCPRDGFDYRLKHADTSEGWAEHLVAMLIEDGWTHDPPWIECVLTRLAFFYPKEMEPVLARVCMAKASGPTPTDPLDDLWLDSSGVPFVDRKGLRDLVRQLADPVNGPSVLLVNGARKSGKTYTVELLRHWQQRRQAAAAPPSNGTAPWLAFVPHYRGMGASLTPEELARKIAIAMQRQDAALPEANATPNRTSHHLVDWVLKQAEASGKEWWVVIDSLNDPDLPEQTRNLVSILAQSVTGPIARKAIRLVLIDYPSSSLHGVLLEEQAREQIGTIGEIDVLPFFHQLLKKTGSVDDDQVKIVVEIVMSLVPAGDLCLLNQALSRAAMRKGSVGGQ